MLEVKKIDAKLDTAELVCTKTDGTKYNVNIFALPLKFVENIYNYEITLDEAKNHKVKLKSLITALNDYKASKENKKKKKRKKSFRICNRIVSWERRYYCFFFKKKEFFCLKVIYLKQRKN